MAQRQGSSSSTPPPKRTDEPHTYDYSIVPTPHPRCGWRSPPSVAVLLLSGLAYSFVPLVVEVTNSNSNPFLFNSGRTAAVALTNWRHPADTVSLCVVWSAIGPIPQRTVAWRAVNWASALACEVLRGI